MGKRVYAAMVALGATPVVERGDGDDDEDIDADFETWKGKLIACLDKNDLIYKSGSLKVTPCKQGSPGNLGAQKGTFLATKSHWSSSKNI